MDEFGRIANFFAPLAGPEGLGLLDDAALFEPPPGKQVVLAKDVAIAGVHFPVGCAPAVAARRSLRPNLSDLAAMGAQPNGYLLGLSLPASVNEDWIASFAKALGEDQANFGLSLWGGDSVSSPQDLSVSITLVGTVPTGTALRRNGAKAGEDIYVSGEIGAAGAGLQMALGQLSSGESCWLKAYEAPFARLSLGAGLRTLATAAIDVSDGLVADLEHLAAASGCAAQLILGDIPIPKGLPLPAIEAIAAGDDYELAFTAPEAQRHALFTLSETLGVKLSRIGKMRDAAHERERVAVFGPDGQALELHRKGWRHM